MSATDQEIRDGCTAIERTLDDEASLSSIGAAIEGASTYYFVGCGSSYWVGVVASYLFQNGSSQTTPVAASEFYVGSPGINEETVVIAYSQSGETTETIRAVEKANESGATTVGITNERDSTLRRTATQAYVTKAGSEESVLATKTVDAALASTLVIAAATRETVNTVDFPRERCERLLDEDLRPAIETFDGATHAYTLGTGVGYGIAGEAATKLTEGALLPTTPLPLMEVSHGPLATVANDPVIVIATSQEHREAYATILDELTAASAKTILIAPRDSNLEADAVIPLPWSDGALLSATKIVQRLTYELAIEQELAPDQPPELTKHVERTVL